MTPSPRTLSLPGLCLSCRISSIMRDLKSYAPSLTCSLPLMGFLKVTIDGAWDSFSSRVNFGIFAKDADGPFVAR